MAPHATDAASTSMNRAESHPQPGAFTSANATRPTAAASSAAPARSGLPRACWSLLSGTIRAASSTARRPTGMLIQNTQRQLSWTRVPPITGPSAAPSAASADQVPIALARPGTGTLASSRESEAGTIRPAPAAWMVRAAISSGTPGDRAHSAEPRLKPAKPATKIPRRPTLSAQRPAGTSTAANTIVYAFSTQDSELRLVPWYSRPMYGNARFTMNRSRLDMKTASARTPTMAVTCRGVRPASSGRAVWADSGSSAGWALASAARMLMIIPQLVRNLDSPYNAELQSVQYSDLAAILEA